VWWKDARVEAYRSGEVGIGPHVKFLLEKTPAHGSAVDVFLEAWITESKMDFTQVEKERNQLLTELVGKLKKNETQELLDLTVAYRLGQIRHAEFYETIKQICLGHSIPLSRYPAMNSYVQYLLLSDSIDTEKLFIEVNQLEARGYDWLAKTENEKRLIRESKKLYLTEKLVNFSLSSDEWREYKTMPAGDNDGLLSFESFYLHAEARDQALTNNLISQLKKNEASTAVLVTGGFHSSGVQNRLLAAGFNVVTFVPKISKIESEAGTSYLSVFTQEKTSLDKLFEGEKLFVSPNPFQIHFQRVDCSDG
jgi:hypothetical protein